jgi:hypothetical protein
LSATVVIFTFGAEEILTFSRSGRFAPTTKRAKAVGRPAARWSPRWRGFDELVVKKAEKLRVRRIGA